MFVQPADFQNAPQAQADGFGRVVAQRSGALGLRPADDGPGEGVGSALGYSTSLGAAGGEQHLPPRFGSDVQGLDFPALGLGFPNPAGGIAAFKNKPLGSGKPVQQPFAPVAKTFAGSEIVGSVVQEPTVGTILGPAHAQAEVYGEKFWSSWD